MRAPQSLPAAFFFFSRSLPPAPRPRDVDDLTRGTTASQRWASTSAAARGRCVRERRRRATRVVCRRPPGRSSGAVAAGNQVARRRRRHRRHSSSLVVGLLLRARESPDTGGPNDEQTNSGGGGGARHGPWPPCSTTPAVDWRPAPRPSSPARAHSHAPAVRPTGRPPWAYRARSHPALASSIIGRAHMVTSSCQISRRQQQRIAAAAGLFFPFHAAKKKSGLRRSTF